MSSEFHRSRTDKMILNLLKMIPCVRINRIIAVSELVNRNLHAFSMKNSDDLSFDKLI